MELHLDVSACPAGQNPLRNLDDHQAISGVPRAVDGDWRSWRICAGKPQHYSSQRRARLYSIFPEYAALRAIAILLFRAWPVHSDLQL